MGLYERLSAEAEEVERRRGRPSERSGGGDSEASIRNFLRAYPDRPGYEADLNRMRSYITYGVTNCFEAMHLAKLRRCYPEEWWDPRYGRISSE